MTLCSFVAYLADDGSSSQTTKTYLAAVRNPQISLEFPDPKTTCPYQTYTDPRRHQPDSFDLGSPAKNTSANHHPTTKHYSEFPP